MLTRRFQMTLPEPFETFAREMDETFSNVVGQRSGAEYAPVGLWDDDGHVYLEIDVPGLREDDLEVTIRDGRLHVAGERKPSERQGKCWYDEHRYGRFERIIALSDLVETDSVEAELKGGVLQLTLRKRPEAQPHRVTIRSQANGKARITQEAEPTPEA